MNLTLDPNHPGVREKCNHDFLKKQSHSQGPIHWIGNIHVNNPRRPFLFMEVRVVNTEFPTERIKSLGN